MRLSQIAPGAFFAPLLLGVLAFGAPAMADPTPAIVNASASADVFAAPDVAIVTAGVLTEAPTAAAAMAANTKQMNAVMDSLKKSGVPAKNIQTAGLNLNPVYNYNNNEAPTLKGYQASNTVSVRTDNIAKVGSTIDSVVAAGANQINGVMFSIKDQDSKLDGARAEAAKKAKAKAENLAAALGMKLGRLVSISEGGGGYSPPMPMMAMAKADSAPIAPGEMQINASVTVTYELTN